MSKLDRLRKNIFPIKQVVIILSHCTPSPAVIFHLSSKADIAQVLQTMATIYSRSGGAVFQHKEVEDIATAWNESFASGEGCNQTK